MVLLVEFMKCHATMNDTELPAQPVVFKHYPQPQNAVVTCVTPKKLK